MWSVFEELCRLRGVTPTSVARETGIPQTTLSNWKKRNNYLNTKAAQKIANYFGVSLQFLMTGEGEATITIPSDQVAREVAEMLHENPVLLEMLYDFRDIDEAHEQRLKGYYDAIMRIERRDR